MNAEQIHPQTNGGRLLKRGDSFDPECSRVSHRLRLAQRLLAVDGIEPIWPDHADECGRHPRRLSNVVHSYRGRVCCTCGRDWRGPTWREGVTGATFDRAYALADEMQSARGAQAQREINARRRAS